jgi:hypothetical protein
MALDTPGGLVKGVTEEDPVVPFPPQYEHIPKGIDEAQSAFKKKLFEIDVMDDRQAII